MLDPHCCISTMCRNREAAAFRRFPLCSSFPPLTQGARMADTHTARFTRILHLIPGALVFDLIFPLHLILAKRPRSDHLPIHKPLNNVHPWDFPGGPVAKTLRSQCKGPRIDPWSENQIPQATAKSSHASTKTRQSQINFLKIIIFILLLYQ